MSVETQSNSGLIAAAIIGAALVIGASVWAMSGTANDSGATGASPAVTFDGARDDVKIEAPYTSIDRDSTGTRIQAPGVDIKLPPKAAD